MKNSIKSNLFTGVIVLLPISLFILVIIWLYNIIDAIIKPFAQYFHTSGIITNLIIVLILLFVQFFIGISARTKIGNWFFTNLEQHIFAHLPGYKTIKSILKPFLGEGYKESFKSVALVDIYNNGVLMTAFITDQHDKYTTVFIPTGPNPTSGNIYHVPKKQVKIIPANVEDVLQSVIAVGAGSSKLINKLSKK